jgi:hypothetical protein
MADAPVRLIWSLSSSGLGTTISGAGSSGSYTAAGNIKSAVDLRYVDDLELLVTVTSKTATPTFAVQFGFFDDQGNLYAPSNLNLPVTLTSTPATALLAAGRHAGQANTYYTFPEWGQIAWTLTGGGSVNGVEITLYGRG